jgi:NADPH:quinone reductase-like Zn-dependent oxidoreductase
VQVVTAQVQVTPARLARIFEWAVTGVLRPQLEQTFAFADAPQAYAASEGGHARGKLIVTVP